MRRVEYTCIWDTCEIRLRSRLDFRSDWSKKKNQLKEFFNQLVYELTRQLTQGE